MDCVTSHRQLGPSAAARRAHVHTLGDGIEGLRRRTAGVGYPARLLAAG